MPTVQQLPHVIAFLLLLAPLGFFIFAFAIAFYGTLAFLRYRREGTASDAGST